MNDLPPVLKAAVAQLPLGCTIDIVTEDATALAVIAQFGRRLVVFL